MPLTLGKSEKDMLLSRPSLHFHIPIKIISSMQIYLNVKGLTLLPGQVGELNSY